MLIVYFTHIIIIAIVIKIVIKKGIEEVLPFFCFMVALFPIHAKIIIPGIFELTPQRSAIAILAVLFLLKRENEELVNNKEPLQLKYLILLNVIWGFLSVMNSVVPSISFKQILTDIIEYYILYFILMKTITNIRTINKILIALVAAIGISSLFGVIEAYTGWSILDIFPRVPGRFDFVHNQSVTGPSMRSTFPHAILFGGAIAVAIPIALYLVNLTRVAWQKWLLWLCIMIMFISIYKVLSRGPWIALVISLVLLFIFAGKSGRKYVAIIGLITLTVLILRPGVWETLSFMVTSTMDSTTGNGLSYQYRFALLHLAVDTLSNDFSRQLVGFGQGSFFYLQLKSDFMGRQYQFLSGDSAWVLFLIETGYVGVILMILLFGKCTLIAWRNFLNISKPDNYLCFIFFVILISFFFQMTSVALYRWGQNAHILWIIIALSFEYGRLARAEKPLSVHTLETYPLQIVDKHVPN